MPPKKAASDPLKLGPFCTAVGLSSDVLHAGPLPTISIDKISNGLVLELARHARLSHMDDSVVASWLTALGLTHTGETIHNAVWSLYMERTTLRRRKQTAKIAILEYTKFTPDDWPVSLPPSEPETESQPPEQPIGDEKELQKKENLSSHEISKKEKHIKTLTNTVSTLQQDINLLEKRKGSLSVRNVNRMKKRNKENLTELARSKRELKQLRQECEDLKATVNDLRLKTAGLEEKSASLTASLSSTKREKHSLQKKYWNKKNVKVVDTDCDQCKKMKMDISERDRIICDLQTQIALHDEKMIVTRNDSGEFCENVRLCVCELIGLEVASGKISEVIKCVGKHLFNYSFLPQQLPSKNTCINIANEGHAIAKQVISEKMQATDAWGLHKDGTTRRKQKILDTSVCLASGETYSLGFTAVSAETGKAIADEAVEKLDELASFQEDPQNFIDSVAASLSYFMSDRAANEKKSNDLLEQWREEAMKRGGSEPKEIHKLYCMAHVLLGFQSYTVKGLEKLQPELREGGRMGRDRNKSGKSFKMLQASSRLCKTASDVFAPVGNYMGIRNLWEAHCRKQSITSIITNYKDNRFNGLFEVSAAITVHRQDFLKLLKQVKDPNSKVKALIADLEDDTLMSIIHALAITYLKVTQPYWCLMVSSSYLQILEPVQKLKDDLNRALQDPSILLDPQPLPSLQCSSSASLIAKVLPAVSPNCPVVLKALHVIVSSLINVFNNQLSSFFDDSSKLLQDGEKMSFAPTTNLVCERHFGVLDASQKRRPSAKLHYHSTVLLLKKNNISSYVSSVPSREKKSFFIKMRYLAKRLRQQHHQKDIAAQYEALEKLNSSAAAKKAVTKAKLAKSKRGKKRASGENRKAAIKQQLPSDVQEIAVGQWIAVAYHDFWHPGIVKVAEGDKFEVDFAEPCKKPGVFKWPNGKDIQTVERKFIIAVNLELSCEGGGRFWNIKDYKNITSIYRQYEEIYF